MKKLTFSLLSLLAITALFFNTSCDKEETELPTVITFEASNIGASTATAGGNITDDGGADIVARGVVWSNQEKPTLQDNSAEAATAGDGQFEVDFTGLSPNTTYYLKAYATNSEGTQYGNQVTFQTTI